MAATNLFFETSIFLPPPEKRPCVFCHKPLGKERPIWTKRGDAHKHCVFKSK